MFNKYYADELAFLREMGREFSQAHPDAAHFLAEAGSDPDVERLLEGFAFLTGRLRQKLDDELPEITHSLMSLLWPHYLRPIPSMTMLQFNPKRQKVLGRQTIPAGTEVDSVPVEGTPCRFGTCCEVDMYPLDLDRVDFNLSAAPPSMTFGFRLWDGAVISAMGLERLRFHLHGDPSATQLLYLWLQRHLKSIKVRAFDETGTERAYPLSQDALKPAGFEEEDSLLPYPGFSFPGFRLLQEYFSLPSKFLFFDLTELQLLAAFEGTVGFEVDFEFDRSLPTPLELHQDGIRLNCTPAINLFAHDADPIHVDHEKVEYRIRPAGSNPLFYEIYSVDGVMGFEKGTSGRREYHPLYSFQSQSGKLREDEIHYHTRQVPSVVGYGTDTYISFVHSDMMSAPPPTETVSIHLICTNRWLPTQLRQGDIRVPTSNTPEFTTFENIVGATTPVMPPLAGTLHWRLISHMALNYLSLTNVEVLKNVLSLYNFHAIYDRQAARANEMRMAAIRSVKTEPTHRLLSGAPVRGTEVEVELQEDQFAGEGDLYLFANVLNEVFSLYATINSFIQLTVRGAQHGEIYQWPPRIGRQMLL